MEQRCFLETSGECLGPDKFMTTNVQRIIAASKIRGDDISQNIEQHVHEVVQVHKKCISTYTSKFHIDRFLEKKRKSEEVNAASMEERPKRSRDSVRFDFRKHCLFCHDVKDCILPSEYDTKVPSERRTPAYNVRTVVMSSLRDIDNSRESLQRNCKKYMEGSIRTFTW